MSPEIILFIFLIICAILLGILIIVLARAIVYIIPMLNGPVFVPSTDEATQTMIDLANLKKGDRIADLGSGDGKIVIALAQKGFQVDGYEINPFLVKQSQQKINELTLENKATIHKKSFWDADLSKYDVVMIYGTTYIMPKLQKKLQQELPKNGRVVSNFFTFPDWHPTKSKNEIYLYTR